MALLSMEDDTHKREHTLEKTHLRQSIRVVRMQNCKTVRDKNTSRGGAGWR